jgi:Putative MetA-pathway of phenol degradation
MTRLTKLLTSALLLSTAMGIAQYTDQINTNRPGQSQSAFAVGKTVFQLESGLNGIYEKHDITRYELYGGNAELALRYGVFAEEFEFMLNMQYQVDQYTNPLDTYTRNAFKQFTFGAKYLLYDPDKYYMPKEDLLSWKANRKFKWHSLIPAVAIYAGVNLIGKNNPYTFPTDGISPKIVGILHNHFGKWVWVNNLIGDKLTTDYISFGWISTVTRGFNERWSGFIEYQQYVSDYYADGVVRLGAAHLLNETMQIDASVSTNFKSTPYVAYGGIGFSWRFDINYKPILLPGKGDREDEFNKEKAKQKEERDKRKKEREERKKNLEEPPAPADEPMGE